MKKHFLNFWYIFFSLFEQIKAKKKNEQRRKTLQIAQNVVKPLFSCILLQTELVQNTVN